MGWYQKLARASTSSSFAQVAKGIRQGKCFLYIYVAFLFGFVERKNKINVRPPMKIGVPNKYCKVRRCCVVVIFLNGLECSLFHSFIHSSIQFNLLLTQNQANSFGRTFVHLRFVLLRHCVRPSARWDLHVSSVDRTHWGD